LHEAARSIVPSAHDDHDDDDEGGGDEDHEDHEGHGPEDLEAHRSSCCRAQHLEHAAAQNENFPWARSAP
jgi:hypothetical protein